jgi:hypothetical protein
MTTPSYARILGLIALPSLALMPWLFLLSRWAREYGVLSNVNIAFVQTITEDMKVSELANRVTAISATVLLVMLAIPAGVLAVRSVWKAGTDGGVMLLDACAWPPVLQVWLAWFIVLAIGVASCSPQVVALFGDSFNNHTIVRISADLTGLLDTQFYVSAIAATFGGTALAAAATAIVLEADLLGNPATDIPKIDPLSRRLDLVLYATAAILVAGIIAVDTWSTWPGPLVGGKDTTIATREATNVARLELRAQGVNLDDAAGAQKVEALKQEKLTDLKNNYSAFIELKNGFIAIQSICYVAGLVFTFLPAAISLNAARRRLAVPVAPSSFGVEQVLRVLALLSPILAGPVAKFISLKLFGP